MYRGFNLDLGETNLSNYISKGRAIHNKNKSLVQEKLESFKDRNGNLIASEIIAKWFRQLKPMSSYLTHTKTRIRLLVWQDG